MHHALMTAIRRPTTHPLLVDYYSPISPCLLEPSPGSSRTTRLFRSLSSNSSNAFAATPTASLTPCHLSHLLVPCHHHSCPHVLVYTKTLSANRRALLQIVKLLFLLPLTVKNTTRDGELLKTVVASQLCYSQSTANLLSQRIQLIECELDDSLSCYCQS